jgi:hypothetical protein
LSNAERDIPVKLAWGEGGGYGPEVVRFQILKKDSQAFVLSTSFVGHHLTMASKPASGSIATVDSGGPGIDLNRWSFR